METKFDYIDFVSKECKTELATADFISGLMMDKIYKKGFADGSAACVERVTFESTTYKSVEPHSCETYDDGEAWRCSKCCNIWKKDYIDSRWERCPKCGSKIIAWK